MPTSVDKQVNAKSSIVKRKRKFIKSQGEQKEEKTLKSRYCLTVLSVFNAQKKKKTTQKKRNSRSIYKGLFCLERPFMILISKGTPLGLITKQSTVVIFIKRRLVNP